MWPALSQKTASASFTFCDGTPSSTSIVIITIIILLSSTSTLPFPSRCQMWSASKQDARYRNCVPLTKNECNSVTSVRFPVNSTPTTDLSQFPPSQNEVLGGMLGTVVQHLLSANALASATFPSNRFPTEADTGKAVFPTRSRYVLCRARCVYYGESNSRH